MASFDASRFDASSLGNAYQNRNPDVSWMLLFTRLKSAPLEYMIFHIYDCPYIEGTMLIVDFFKMLADETRLQSLLLIAEEKELCVCELAAALDVSQPKISRHLAQLRQLQVLSDRREGQWVYYSLHPQLPGWAGNIIQLTLTTQTDYLKPCQQRLQAMGDRPHRLQRCC